MADLQTLQIGGREYVSFATARGYLRCTDGTLNLYIAQGKLRTTKARVGSMKRGQHEYIELESLQTLLAQLLAKR